MNILKMNIYGWMAVFVVAAFAGAILITTTAPQAKAAHVPGTGAGGGTATLDDSCNKGFLGFPSWYRGLADPSNNCELMSPSDLNTSGKNDGLSNFIWRIALNVVEMAVVALAYLSGFMFLYGGWMFIISQGKPESAAKARSIMTMSGVGLVLLLSAVALTEFIFNAVIK
jgi:hypothetical protein